jgi:hypothetical protein
MKKSLILIALAIVTITLGSCRKECACKDENGQLIREVKTSKDCETACDEAISTKKI